MKTPAIRMRFPALWASPICAAVTACCPGTPTVLADEPRLDFSLQAETGVLRLSAPSNAAWYYTLQGALDLENFTPMALALGVPAPVWEYRIPDLPHAGFFRLRAVNVFAPEDTDRDGIDDLYELAHASVLNPLEPADASRVAQGSGLTFLQEYRGLFRYGTNALQVFSHEATVFNLGSALAPFDAVSREMVLYNFGSAPSRIEALSSEVSVYNGNVIPASVILQTYSRELTAYNFGSPPARIEAVSAEVSVYNGERVPWSDLNQVISQELSVFNHGSATSPLEAISRETTLLNFRDPGGP